MGRALRVRIPVLNKDVSVHRLTSSEIRSKFYDPATRVSVPVPETDNLETDLFVYGVSSIITVIMSCIPSFEERIVPELVALSDDDLCTVITELYSECVMANPALDHVAACMFGTRAPLPAELERLSVMLPSELSPIILNHMFRHSVTDHMMVDEAIADNQVLDVPDETIEVLNDVELNLDLERVRALMPELTSRMVGQRHAIDHMVSVARRAAVGFHDPERPPAVAMFVGPPGVGKTMLAKEAARVLFGKDAFGRIDCAQLADKMSHSKLLGPGPGYVGYPSSRDPRNSKPEDIKKQDPSIIYKETLGMGAGGILLIDEIEKADSDALDVMLTAFDEGYVKTSVGNVVNLRNVFIIITSNLGSKELSLQASKNPLGFGLKARKDADETAEKMANIVNVRDTTMKAIREWMKPELLSRVTSVVPFMDLTLDDLAEVVDLEWDRASKHMGSKIDAKVFLTDGLKKHLADKAHERHSGARYVSRLVDSYLVDTIADMYVSVDGMDAYRGKITLDVGDGEGFDSVKATYGDDTYTHVVSDTIGDD